jgi:bifunctional enzyme CysN/CysC
MKLESLTGAGSGDLLRFLTCGSVDDGKSTLLGRLLYETQQIPEDQVSALKNDSKRFGTTGNDVDLALLVDGLEAEREQGITIDVSYRFFRTPRRSFVAADTPGHEQYTRNMATGASTSDLAIILVDARKGILTQTRRHSIICSLLGIRHVVLAINKFDLVGYSQSVFSEIVATYSSFSTGLGFSNIVPIPVSARYGDNVSELSLKTEWYSGPTLLGHLETAELQSEAERQPFRMPIQWVNRPDLNLRGYCGTIASGQVKVGDEIIVVPSRLSTVVSRIITPQGEADVAARGEAVTVILERDIDISRVTC